jgi:activating signal cointegrator complex subunit 1
MASPKYTNRKPPLTHFLCLPLLTPASIPQLQESLSRFKLSVASPNRAETPAGDDADTSASTTDAVIPEKAFRPLGVLHLTLGVMSLRSPDKINDAKDLLESLDLSQLLREAGRDPAVSSQDNDGPSGDDNAQRRQDHPPSEPAETDPTCLETLNFRPKLSAEPLIVSLQGLHAFPSPRKATVLHCPPCDPTSRLHPFCLKVKQMFVEAGLMEPENRPLVLHATIVNTVYAKRDRRNEKRRVGSISFDATEIVRKYNEHGGTSHGGAPGEFVWADDILIDRVRICEMGAEAVDDATLEQEYKVFAEKII